MDVSGRLITELVYDELKSIKYNKSFLAKKGKNYMLLNNFGERITENNFLDIEPVYQLNPQSRYSNPGYSYLKVKYSNLKYGLIDQVKLEIIEGEFDDIQSEFQNKLLVKQNGKFGLYNVLSKAFEINAEYDQLTHIKGVYYGFKGKEIFKIKSGANVVTTKLK